MRLWRERNPEKVKAYHKKHFAKFPHKAVEGLRRLQEWADKNPERRADRILRRKYGLTLDGYNAIYTEQGGVCAICGKPPIPEQKLHVDHNHATKVVRGLLCHACNKGLGLFKDNAEILEAASMYLRSERT